MVACTASHALQLLRYAKDLLGYYEQAICYMESCLRYTMHAGSTRRKPRHCAAQASQSNHTADLQRRGLLQLPALALLCKTLGVHAAEGMTLVALSYIAVRTLPCANQKCLWSADSGTGTVPFEDGTDKFSIQVEVHPPLQSYRFLDIFVTQQCGERPSMPAQVPDGWMFGTGGAAGGKGFSGASGTRRALAWCAAVSTL